MGRFLERRVWRNFVLTKTETEPQWFGPLNSVLTIIPTLELHRGLRPQEIRIYLPDKRFVSIRNQRLYVDDNERWLDTESCFTVLCPLSRTESGPEPRGTFLHFRWGRKFQLREHSPKGYWKGRNPRSPTGGCRRSSLVPPTWISPPQPTVFLGPKLWIETENDLHTAMRSKK